jgi:hypothetical protein
MPTETDNLRLEELYKADQKDRERIYSSPEAVVGLRQRDAKRRELVTEMMAQAQVNTPKDLYHAGVIFLHGLAPRDFLTAHRLSSMSAISGHRPSRWLTAASLDRFLMSVGLPQLYATQFEHNPQEKRYELKLPIEDAGLMSFEKNFFNIPAVAERLSQLNARIQSQ